MTTPPGQPQAASRCTDDIFRTGSWDYVSNVSDYQALWYPTMGFISKNAPSYIDISDMSLKSALPASAWNFVNAIPYVDIDVAWSTLDFQNLDILMTDLLYTGRGDPNRNGDIYAGTLSGNFPSGTLGYIRILNDPETGAQWSRANMADWRVWTIRPGNNIDATHRGLFVQSITETDYFTFGPASGCPAGTTQQ